MSSTGSPSSRIRATTTWVPSKAGVQVKVRAAVLLASTVTCTRFSMVGSSSGSRREPNSMARSRPVTAATRTSTGTDPPTASSRGGKRRLFSGRERSSQSSSPTSSWPATPSWNPLTSSKPSKGATVKSVDQGCPGSRIRVR